MSDTTGRDDITPVGEIQTPVGEIQTPAGEIQTPAGAMKGSVKAIKTQPDEITRTTGPQTTNGRRWEVQLSGIPPVEWLALFKVSGDSSARALPQRVEFDRASAVFKSEEDQVEHWIQSIDRWIASTNTRYLTNLERARRERLDRLDIETKEKERIQRMNDRFKDL